MSTLTFISVAEAAEIAGVSNETIRQLCKAGTLRYQKKTQLYYPCKEDVNRYADTISKVHSIHRDIERYKNQLEKQREELRIAVEEKQNYIEGIKLFPHRVERIAEIVFSLLQQYQDKQATELSEREIEILFKMYYGETFYETGQQMQLTRERVRQVWLNILKKLGRAKNALEYKDEIIAELKEQIKQLEEEIKSIKHPTLNVDPNLARLLVMPISSLGLSNRVEACLHDADIIHVMDIVRCHRRILFKQRGIGNKTLKEVDSWLAEHGLRYEMPIPEEVDIDMLGRFLQNEQQ